MKVKTCFAASLCLLCAGVRSQASQDQLVQALSADWTFEDDIKASVKLDEAGVAFKSIRIQIKDKSIEIPPAEFKDLRYPDVSRITLIKLTSLTDGPMKWAVKIHYFYDTYTWGEAWSEVTFHLSDTEYLSRETKIPTGKDTWKYVSKEKGKPEASSGTGGKVEGIK
ncbi:hypothetical protein KBB96_09525 [Luteolibacter ambystomatis]|uniref:Uncharacterized protein n=1 Tax=Luteolibacter ambystomatis TaxID=2824561 RepID=A0A975J344_9BACT|nr:hypothetical protein [Luteolibacter ambystomatis]QUE53119.1 hypothetical protein KBB96_09525 [Luteolibacter ambystomatis]